MKKILFAILFVLACSAGFAKNARFEIVHQEFMPGPLRAEVDILLDKETNQKYLVFRDGSPQGLGTGITPLLEPKTER